MATLRQRTRMGALGAALRLLRQRQFTPGYSLVVSGGAYTPGTKPLSDNFTINENESSVPDDLASPHFSPLTSASCAPPGRHLVVAGGAATLYPPCIDFDFALGLRSCVLPCRMFRTHPTCPTCIGSFALVVPGRFWLWHRAGIG